MTRIMGARIRRLEDDVDGPRDVVAPGDRRLDDRPQFADAGAADVERRHHVGSAFGVEDGRQALERLSVDVRRH